jgi:pimeloyl-ACP methyl ester carboxylesterase
MLYNTVMIRHEIKVMGSRVIYWERNPEAPQTLILVHGFRGNHKALTPMAQHLNDYRLIMLDLPGYGESGRMDVEHTIANYALALDEFFRQLDLNEFDLWSHSFGASVALVWAAQTKLKMRRLIMVSPALQQGGMLAAMGRLYYVVGRRLPQPLQKPWLASRLVARMSGRMLIKNVSPRREAQMIANGQRDINEFKSDVVVEGYVDFYQQPLMELAPQVNAPALVIGGRLDQLVSVELLKKLTGLLPDARLEVIEQSGHLSPLEQPGHVARISKEFLNQ